MGGAALEEFACNETIYANIRLPQKSTGTHLLEGRWIKPDGSQQEYTKVQLELKEPQDLVYMWLKFERASDVVDALFTRHEDDDLEGVWKLDVFWDRKKVATKKFSLHCG